MDLSTSRAFENYFHHVLQKAVECGSSDVHVEPFPGMFQIKFRVDGVLRVFDRQILDNKRIERFAEVTRKICGFDMGKDGKPLDARFCVPLLPYDFRSSLCPTMHGEKIVLRLLQKNKTFDLQTYPLRDDAKSDLLRAINRSQGMILVSGPTGSGKTTLLYNALSAIDRIANNVHSIEDPIEYSLPNLGQTQISHGVLSFAEVLRSLMRQDPDVILVGEIRDEETARAAIHASCTGHLVLSTVHANSASEIVERMEGLGVNRDLFLANLAFASAQRLVSKNCSFCSEEDPDSVALVRAVFEEDIVPKQGKGCEHCGNSGVKGMVLLFEWMTRERDNLGKKIIKTHDSIRNQSKYYMQEGVINAQNACGTD
jgi:type IV pilus assembly protein PilB